jgi:chromosome segregation ATPase
MLEAEMALSDAKVRCSDVERQLEDVRAELEMRWLKTSQECELEKQEKKKLTSKLLEIEEELARTNEQLEDVRAEVLKSAQDGESLQKQWLRTLQDGELEKQEKREVKFKLSEMEEELTRILEEMQTASKLQIECQSRFENELHEQKEEQSRMQVCLGEMQLELDKTYQEKKELEKQREQRDEMTSESNAKLMNFQKQLDAMKKDLEESQEAKRLLKEQLDEIQLMGLEETCGQYLREKQELGTQLDEVASNLARKEQELMYAEKERDEKAEIAGRVETLSQRLVEVVKSGKKVEEELQEVQHSLANNVMQREAAQTELQTNKTVMTAFRSVFNYTDYTIQRLLHDLDAMKKVLDESYEFEKSIVSSIEEAENEKQAARAAVAAEYSLLFL